MGEEPNASPPTKELVWQCHKKLPLFTGSGFTDGIHILNYAAVSVMTP